MISAQRIIAILTLAAGMLIAGESAHSDDPEMLSLEQLESVRRLERQRIDTIQQVMGSVIAIYGEERQGGGSGVIIDPTGIGLTNHHVIIGAGTSGWGGLADGQLYRWKLVGTDPGGDVAIIQMEGREEFPFTPLGDSDAVQVGDWALAMGNPFVLSEDQSPTVTLGIVSGIKRYQPGAGLNELVYGNCIQTDSSINPGNSGGPLFNMRAQVIGINGRGSFLERGRVNVGLGYAISANQLRNFIPELLATKLVEHGTLDANFEDRDGKVVCSNLFEDSKLYRAGVRPGDELLSFEGESILTANQFTSLICTLPENWPAELTVRRMSDGQSMTVHTRLYGLPYKKIPRPKIDKNEQERTPEEKEKLARDMDMYNLMTAPPGTVRAKDINQKYVRQMLGKWTESNLDAPSGERSLWEISDEVFENGAEVGGQSIWISSTGEFKVESRIGGREASWFWDGIAFTHWRGEVHEPMSLVEAKLNPGLVQAMGIVAANRAEHFAELGDILLDGSDKAHRHHAWRFRITDADDDPIFFWLGSKDKGADKLLLLKTAADENSEQEPGGILFDDWQSIEGLRIARERKSILGLAEIEQRAFRTQSVVKKSMADNEWRQTLNFPAAGKGK